MNARTQATTKTLELIMCGESSEIEAVIDYTYTPGGHGARERGSGLPLEPDYGPEVEIEAIKVPVRGAVIDILRIISGEHRAAIESAIAEEIEA